MAHPTPLLIGVYYGYAICAHGASMVSGIGLICFVRMAHPTPLLIVFIVVMLLRAWRLYGFRH